MDKFSQLVDHAARTTSFNKSRYRWLRALKPACLLIATDEAGYGPKLGPLVIVSTLWKMPSSDAAGHAACFEAFQEATSSLGKSFSIADSKKLFKSGVAGSLAALRSVTWASLRALGRTETHLRDCLASIVPRDFQAILDTSWLDELDDVWGIGNDLEFGMAADKVWSTSPARLVAVRARIIPPRQFNEACEAGMNKSDLLSSATLGLVADLVDVAQDLVPNRAMQFDVYCDRHGGRRFYGGVLQHTFPERTLYIESETSQQSIYRLERESKQLSEQILIRFTVKGDSYLPVSLSSMIAKFLRECSMRSFNAYFSKRPKAPVSLRPTAGYPVDADRFLRDVEPIITSENIDRKTLVRSR